MQKTVFFFRHGETDWNRDRRIQGHSDIQLNETGREQARRLALELNRMDIELILSSDLSRALDTARAVARVCHVPIITNKALRETFYGDAEGLTDREIVAKFGPEIWERWLSIRPEDQHLSFPGGETKAQLRARLIRAMEWALRHFPHSRVAVSTHGGALRRIMNHVRPEALEPARIPNCVLYETRFDIATGKWSTTQD